MQKRKESLFSEKFRLLNSQDHVEEIKWSSSESSDVENISRNGKCSNLNNKVQRKRKRKKTKQKNLSNLSITIVDTSKDLIDVKNIQKSPTLQVKNEKNLLEKSPIFAPTPSYSRAQKCMKIQESSPILTCKMSSLQCRAIEKSPIVSSKYISPKSSPKVRKKLFNFTQTNSQCLQKKSGENLLNVGHRVNNPSSETQNQILLDRRKSQDLSLKSENIKLEEEIHQTQPHSQYELQLFSNAESMYKQELPLEEEINIQTNKIKIEIPESQDETPRVSPKDLDNSFTNILKKSNTESEKRVKSYFENHFSSGNASQSQHSISDCPTQKNFSKSSDDVEIISIITQVNSNRASFQSEHGLSKNPSPISSQSAELGSERSKKMRYKRDGLAFRLNALLKKQNANISLWLHERFLADNSNFLIPKGEHSVYLIQKVTLIFGSYLLEGIDVSDSKVLILVPSNYVQELNICENMIFKLYEPYKVLKYKANCKLIINVCKFECLPFKE